MLESHHLTLCKLYATYICTCIKERRKYIKKTMTWVTFPRLDRTTLCKDSRVLTPSRFLICWPIPWSYNWDANFELRIINCIVTCVCVCVYTYIPTSKYISYFLDLKVSSYPCWVVSVSMLLDFEQWTHQHDKAWGQEVNSVQGHLQLTSRASINRQSTNDDPLTLKTSN